MYINDLHKNSTDGCVIPTILNETPATAWVDGKNGLGAVVGNFCMDLAIQKAKNVGVGVVAAKGSNHYGCLRMLSSVLDYFVLMGRGRHRPLKTHNDFKNTRISLHLTTQKFSLISLKVRIIMGSQGGTQ